MEQEGTKFYINSIPVYRRYVNDNWEYRVYEDNKEGTVIYINGTDCNMTVHAQFILDFLYEEVNKLRSLVKVETIMKMQNIFD